MDTSNVDKLSANTGTPFGPALDTFDFVAEFCVWSTITYDFEF